MVPASNLELRGPHLGETSQRRAHQSNVSPESICRPEITVRRSHLGWVGMDAEYEFAWVATARPADADRHKGMHPDGVALCQSCAVMSRTGPSRPEGSSG